MRTNVKETRHRHASTAMLSAAYDMRGGIINLQMICKPTVQTERKRHQLR